MFYNPCKEPHGLPHDPFKALVAPRPIGWISSVSKDGHVNLAPYSYFNAVSSNPPHVIFASEGLKDSRRNVEETGEFVCSLATYDLREQMNTTSATVANHVDEFDLSGLTPIASTNVKPPRVAESPIALECKYHQTVVLPGPDGVAGSGSAIVIGRVVGIHIDDTALKDGMVDLAAIKPIARLGYKDYAVVDDTFSLTRPGQS